MLQTNFGAERVAHSFPLLGTLRFFRRCQNKSRSLPKDARLWATGLVICAIGSFGYAQPSEHARAMAYLGAGLRLYDLQRYAEAANEFALALKLDPSLLNARSHLALSYFQEHKFVEARQQFQKLLMTNHRRRWVTYYLGRLDLEAGHVDDAMGRFESLGTSTPLQDELYYLGSALLKKGQRAQAATFLRREIAFNPLDFRAHYLLGRADLKLGQAQAAQAEFHKSEVIHQYYLRGKQDLAFCREQLQAGRHESAWTRCGSVLQTNDIDKLVAVGTLFGEFHDYPHALDALRKAVSLDPESPEVNYDLAYTWYQTGSYLDASRYSQRAIVKRPDFFEALEVRGMALHRLGRDTQARPALEHAHQLRPNDATVTEVLRQITARPGGESVYNGPSHTNQTP